MADGIEITFANHVSMADRHLAEQSVYAMVEQTRAKSLEMLKQRAELRALSEAVFAPIEALLMADPKAAAALETSRSLRVKWDDTAPPDSGANLVSPGLFPQPPTNVIYIPGDPPYDYAWKWHDTNGGAPVLLSSDIDGALAVQAASGSVEGVRGADSFVSAHAGVGMLLHIDRTLPLFLSVTHDTSYRWRVRAQGISSSATTDGGFEANYMKDGQVYAAVGVPQWHQRVSGVEDRTGFGPETRNVSPNGMGSQISAGVYGIHFGIWAVTDYSNGIGQAASIVKSRANVAEMRIWST
jgi:hypothetical protein